MCNEYRLYNVYFNNGKVTNIYSYYALYLKDKIIEGNDENNNSKQIRTKNIVILQYLGKYKWEDGAFRKV